MLAGRGATMEIKVRIFDSRHPDVDVLVDDPGSYIVAQKNLGDGNRAAPVGDAKFGANKRKNSASAAPAVAVP